MPESRSSAEIEILAPGALKRASRVARTPLRFIALVRVDADPAIRERASDSATILQAVAASPSTSFGADRRARTAWQRCASFETGSWTNGRLFPPVAARIKDGSM